MNQALLAAALLAALAGCHPTAPTPPQPSTAEEPVAELRVYKVPAAFQGELRGVIAKLLWRGRNVPELGSAAIGPDGTLLVTAPPAFHAGVADLVARMEKSNPAPPPTLEMQYWMLLGRAAAAPTPSDRFDGAIRTTVERLQAEHGPMDLRLVERMQVRSLSGVEAEAEGASTRVRQSASVRGESVLAEIQFMPGEGREFRTSLQLPRGETVVLGYAGLSGKTAERTFPEMQPDEPAPTAYYVVRGAVAGRE